MGVRELAILHLRFEEVSELGEHYRKFKGKYLVCELHVLVQIVDKHGQKHEIPYVERFILDTGSPFTILRQQEFERVSPIPIEELQLQEVQMGTKRGTELYREVVFCLPDVSFPQLGVHLPEAYLSCEDRPFSLLGTDCLESFRLFFDPKSKEALLWGYST